MKYIILYSVLFTSMFACGEKSEKPSPDAETASNNVWQQQYRCPVEIDVENSYKDELGFSTLSDSTLASEIFSAVREGKVEVFDEDMNPLTKNEALSTLQYFKMVHVEVEPGIYEDHGDTLNFSPEQVIEILAREKWSLSEEYALQKEVLAYAPVVATFDGNGNRRGKRILFWIKNPGS